MTSHVDFTSLIQTAEEAGLETVGLTTQSQFLTALGIAGALAGAARGDLPLEEYYSRRRALTELLDPAGLGRIRVLIQSKGVGRPRLLALEPD
jgi:SAM-dependent MidA family methyltransferase